MKKLQCELCGSTDFVKENEFFMCQHCGAKYTPENARIMIMGKVEIDQSEKLTNLYQLARRAKKNNDTADGYKYYSEIAPLAPNDWEAAFYSVCFREYECTIDGIISSAKTVANGVPSTCELIKRLPDSEQEAAYKDMDNGIKNFATIMINAAYKVYQETRHSRSIDTDTFDRIDACSELMLDTAERVADVFHDYVESASMVKAMIEMRRGLRLSFSPDLGSDLTHGQRDRIRHLEISKQEYETELKVSQIANELNLDDNSVNSLLWAEQEKAKLEAEKASLKQSIFNKTRHKELEKKINELNDNIKIILKN